MLLVCACCCRLLSNPPVLTQCLVCPLASTLPLLSLPFLFPPHHQAMAAGALPTTQAELLAAGAATCKLLDQHLTSAASAALVPSDGVTECYDGTALVSGAQAIWSHLVCCPVDETHTSSTTHQPALSGLLSSLSRRLLSRRDRRVRDGPPGSGSGNRLGRSGGPDGTHDGTGDQNHQGNGRRLLGGRRQ
jgi:hypothetical protein